ncbi:MAG: hypothetical protein ACI9XK_004489 [Granulosicoccus sp.]|jgi:hypothetical protein
MYPSIDDDCPLDFKRFCRSQRKSVKFVGLRCNRLGDDFLERQEFQTRNEFVERPLVLGLCLELQRYRRDDAGARHQCGSQHDSSLGNLLCASAVKKNSD